MQEVANNESDACLVVFFKAPARSKRRLVEEIGELATQAAAHLWECVVEDLESWQGPVVFAPAELDDAGWLDEQLNEAHTVVLQRGTNLGERINHVDEVLRHSGETRLIFVGTDCPSMAPDYLTHAAQQLNVVDVVLGPASDGGVVLMGSRVAWPPLARLSWSTNELGHELEEACTEAGFTVGVLEPRDDVDTADALLAVRPSLATDSRPARRALKNWLPKPGAAWQEQP